MGLFSKFAKKPTHEQGDNAPKEILMPAEEALEIADAFWTQEKFEDSFRYFSIAAEQGNPRALNGLGCCYRFGEGVEEDVQKSLGYFEAALAGGYIKAAGHIGQIYYDGEGGVECDYDKAFPLLQQSAMAGIGFAMTSLSDAYYFGNGCEDNEKLAAYWAYQAVEHENEGGYYWLGMYFDEGIFFSECPAVAKYCFEKAAECGFEVDEYLESEKYQAVEAVEPDFIEFDDSDPSFFTQECPYAQYLRALSMLDGMDTDGNIVRIDARGGQKLLERAAGQGYSEAQYSLGAKFLNTNDGGGIKYDEDGSVSSLGCDTGMAMFYLDLAARQGHPEALDALITLYSIGDIDIEQDMEKADEYQAIKYKLFQDEEDCPDDEDGCSDDEDDWSDDADDEDEDETESDGGRCFRYVDYVSGDRYEGEYENGMRNGRGKFFFASGDSYEGDFVDNMFEGHGKYFYSDGDVSEGEFRNDMMNGAGTFRALNGDTYDGDYYEGERCGYGEAYYASEDSTYKGAWRKGYWHGVGKRIYNNGEWYFGQFSEGVIQGYGVYFDNTIYHIGLFEKGICVTENNIKNSMRNPEFSDIGDGCTCYWDRPKDYYGYSIFRGNGQTLYAKNDDSWVARYNSSTGKMDVGTVDSESRLDDEKAVTVYVDNLVAIGRIKAGVPNGRAVMQYMSGVTVEGEFQNGEISAVIKMTDKYGNDKTQ